MNNTLIKGLQILEALTRSERAMGVSELAILVGMGKSNVHRLLQALVELRFVLRDEEQSLYRASLKMWELGSLLHGRLDVKRAAGNAMLRLLEQTRETVHLSMLDGDDVVYIHKMESLEPVRAYSELGGRAPAYCVATGKALLAYQPRVHLDRVSLQLISHSPHSIVDQMEFLREMEKVRTTGYAVNRGEWRESVWGIAAPIRDDTGTVRAAIGISGPSARIKPSQIKALAAHVLDAAATITREIS
jgi:DNA-binding IclR family transcriptional regulator